MNSPQLTHVTKLSSTLMSICWQTELNLIQKVRPGSTICSPKCANSIRKHRLVAGVAAGCMCLFNDELLTPTVVSSTRARVSSGTLQCVHSQCILTGFYKTYKIIWEGIQFLETCYSVPFKKKKKEKTPKPNRKQWWIKLHHSWEGLITIWSAMLTFWTPELEQKMLNWDGEKERHKF